MVVSTVLLGVMLQVPKLTGAMGGKRGATHKPCENQGTWRWRLGNGNECVEFTILYAGEVWTRSAEDSKYHLKIMAEPNKAEWNLSPLRMNVIESYSYLH